MMNSITCSIQLIPKFWIALMESEASICFVWIRYKVLRALGQKTNRKNSIPSAKKIDDLHFLITTREEKEKEKDHVRQKHQFQLPINYYMVKRIIMSLSLKLLHHKLLNHYCDTAQGSVVRETSRANYVTLFFLWKIIINQCQTPKKSCMYLVIDLTYLMFTRFWREIQN